MKVRSYRSADAAQIDEIYERCGHGHARPELDKLIGSVVIEHDGKIIAYGALQALAEASIILDTDAPQKVKVQALKECLRAAFFCASLNGYSEVYAFTAKDGFDKTLQRHFEFEPSEPILRRKI